MILFIKMKNIYDYDIPNEILINLEKEKQISVDTEALGLNIKRDRLCLIQIADSKKNIFFIKFPDYIYNKSSNLKKLFKNKKIEKIFHFARFDVAIIFFYLNVMCKNIVCTKIMSKIARTFTERHGLKELCQKLLNVDLNKNNCCSYWGGDLNEQQIKYAGNDVIYLLDIKNKLIEILKKEKRWTITKKCFSIISTIVECDIIGYDPTLIINHH